LAPRDFWALSLPEWRALLNPRDAVPGLRRAELEHLMRAFPDG
jgi:hypothetical protein